MNLRNLNLLSTYFLRWHLILRSFLIISLVNVVHRDPVLQILLLLWFIVRILTILVCNAELCRLIFRLRVCSIHRCFISTWNDLERIIVGLDQARVFRMVCREEAFSVRCLDIIWLVAVFLTAALAICVDFVICLLSMLVTILIEMVFWMVLWISDVLRLRDDLWLLMFGLREVVVSRIALLLFIVEWINIVIRLALVPIPAVVLGISRAFTATRIQHWVFLTFVFDYKNFG